MDPRDQGSSPDAAYAEVARGARVRGLHERSDTHPVRAIAARILAATWVAGDGPVALPAGTGFRSAGRIRVDVRRRVATTYELPFVPRGSVVTLITETTPPARRAWTEQVACGTLRNGSAADLLAVRPLLDRSEARLWIARPGAPAAIVGWFRDFDPLYPRTYWLQRPIEFTPDARLSSEGPCRVELTLSARVRARR